LPSRVKSRVVALHLRSQWPSFVFYLHRTGVGSSSSDEAAALVLIQLPSGRRKRPKGQLNRPIAFLFFNEWREQSATCYLYNETAQKRTEKGKADEDRDGSTLSKKLPLNGVALVSRGKRKSLTGRFPMAGDLRDLHASHSLVSQPETKGTERNCPNAYSNSFRPRLFRLPAPDA
jgi:hypothetical protein